MRRWWMAALLSILTPGLGQAYNGQIGKGIRFFLGLYAVYFPATLWLTIRFPSFTTYLALAAGAAMIVLWMIADAVVFARRIGDQFVPKSYNRVPVYLAIIIAFSIVGMIVSGVIREKWVQAYKLPSASMQQSLLIGDHIFVQKRSVLIRRGDIVVYEFPEDPSKDFIHRVIGIPGDTVEIREKSVLINGTPLSEPYVQFSEGKGLDSRVAGGAETETIVRTRDNLVPVKVPAEKYFVMGDNRDRSYDSRFWGFVDKSKVKGIARSIYFSWDKDKMQVRWSRIGMPLGEM
jgi:signal peptidase I